MSESDSNRPDSLLTHSDLPEIVRKIRARTPARLLVGRAGAAYRTATQLDLSQAHAAAKDAVRAELDLHAAFGAEFICRWDLFEVQTQARQKDEYLLRPDLGRHFDAESRAEIQLRCPRQADLQIAIGDGLSVSAIEAQVPLLLPLLWDGAAAHNWTLGKIFVIRHCRVGILNEIGELLDPAVAVLLIGERPGLSTAQSLSAYMAYRPRPYALGRGSKPYLQHPRLQFIPARSSQPHPESRCQNDAGTQRRLSTPRMKYLDICSR